MNDDITGTIAVERLIVIVRNQKVILDSTLAELYQVETKRLVEAVKRNKKRFPIDFVFQLSTGEFQKLNEKLNHPRQRGGRRTPPYAFTEQGVAMASSVLNSDRAISVNIEIMRVFVRIRQVSEHRRRLEERLDEIEARLGSHDGQIRSIFDAIKVMLRDQDNSRPIGFARNESK